jgi:uncharacterized repeat protein (TIGR03806 family)
LAEFFRITVVVTGLAFQASYLARNMNFRWIALICCGWLCLGGYLRSSASPALVRQPNTSIQLPAVAPGAGYAATNALGDLVFVTPVYVTCPPGETNQLFVVERAGRIIVVTNLAAPTKTTFFDLRGRVLTNGNNGMMSMAFHPGYATNRFFFLFYSLNTTTTNLDGSVNAQTLHQRIARFETSSTNANYAATNTELPLLTERDVAAVHDPNDLQFGPDGYLYVARPFEGPNSPGGDPLKNTQRIDTNLYGGFLRLDVDHRPGSLPPNPHHSHFPSASSYNNHYGLPSGVGHYAIPADNPFVGATANPDGTPLLDPARVRTEFWAVGLRNPFRFTFDADGTLYCGDVGYNGYDEVNLIVRGGNYGWPFREGWAAGPRAGDEPDGFTALPPLLALPVADWAFTNQLVSRALIGGVVYRGTQFPELQGKYIFGDNWQGTIWAATLSGSNPASAEYLFTDVPFGPVQFARHPATGELLWVNLQGTVNRLTYVAPSVDLPTNLSDTGVFSDLPQLTPQPGVVPYQVNVPFWSDGALKFRWFSVPDATLPIHFQPDYNWSFPTGTVWVKHFELELTNGVSASRRRLETRLLVKHETGVYGLTYRWGDSITNALLVPAGGATETFVTYAAGLGRTQTWHYPSRMQCLSCHNQNSGGALGFNTAQLNRDFDYDGQTTNQLQALADAGYFSAPLTNRHALRALAPAEEASISLEYRVRSYLEANCSYCHQPGGPTPGLWDGRIATQTLQAGLIDGALAENFGNLGARVIARGNVVNSMIPHRVAASDAGRMPPLGSTVQDEVALGLLSAWITNDLPGVLTWSEWQLANFGATNHPAGGPADDFDGDRASNELEFLTGTDPTNELSNWVLSLTLSNATARLEFPRLANRSYLLEFATNLSAAIWYPVDRAENRPRFASTNTAGTLWDTTGGAGEKFYRVRVTAP